MALVPSGALSGAAASAIALADVVARFARQVPLPTETALSTARTCRQLGAVQAVRLRGAGDVAALAARLTTTLQVAARAAEPADAAPLLYAAADGAQACVPRSASPILTRRFRLAAALSAGLEVTALGEAFLAEARTGFADQRAAVAARARIASAFDAAAERIGAQLGQEVLATLQTAVRETTRHLVELATTLQPVVRVETQGSLPSTALAFGLYGDPARAPDLVARNAVGTSLFMPTSLEAVAPKA